jgi:hypothetical protein
MLAGAMKGDMSRYDMTPTNTPLKMAPREVTTKNHDMHEEKS